MSPTDEIDEWNRAREETLEGDVVSLTRLIAAGDNLAVAFGQARVALGSETTRVLEEMLDAHELALDQGLADTVEDAIARGVPPGTFLACPHVDAEQGRCVAHFGHDGLHVFPPGAGR